MTSQTWTKENLSEYVGLIDGAALELEQASPAEIIRWAADQVGASITVTCSFEDAVLAHVAAVAVPGIEIIMIDTQYLFAETLWFAEQLRARFDLNLRIIRPLAVQPDNRWQTDTAGCCGVRKVEPLNKLLSTRTAWVTGVRRVDGPTRADTPVLSIDTQRNVLKVNPLALFTDEDIATYESIHDLPRNPLSDRGYSSIGCWPCTRPVAPGEDKRAGRWSGQAKTECGLHV